MFLLCDVSDVHSSVAKPYRVSVNISEVPVAMEIDAGSGISVISADDFQKLHTNGQKSFQDNSGFLQGNIISLNAWGNAYYPFLLAPDKECNTPRGTKWFFLAGKISTE